MDRDLPGWEKKENPLPSPREAALGLYLQNCEEQKLSPAAAAEMTVNQLLEIFPSSHSCRPAWCWRPLCRNLLIVADIRNRRSP